MNATTFTPSPFRGGPGRRTAPFSLRVGEVLGVHVVEEVAERGDLLLGLRLGDYARDAHDLFGHEDLAAGPHRQGEGIRRTSVDLERAFSALEEEPRVEGACFDAGDLDPLDLVAGRGD